MKSLSFEEKYAALVRKDSSFEGVFTAAVKTTGIFCRPTCTARKPKPKNVVFFNSPSEALANGYRACKVCKPLEPEGILPNLIQKILHDLAKNPDLRIKDADLKQRGIDPNWIRRWFKKHHGITFHAYQRMLRINFTHKQLAIGQTVTRTAFDAGFESLSGFNESYLSIFGKTPTNARNKSVINAIRFTTPLGPMFGYATDQGVCLVEFANRKTLKQESKDLCRLLSAVILPGTNPHLEQLQSEIAEYFAGKRKKFNVHLHYPGTEFQKSVWSSLAEIQFGETSSYKQLALEINRPRAVRAVGAANGQNRISILVPCHRVIGTNGNLTGYGGGIARKKWLLDFEKNQASNAFSDLRQKT